MKLLIRLFTILFVVVTLLLEGAAFYLTIEVNYQRILYNNLLYALWLHLAASGLIFLLPYIFFKAKDQARIKFYSHLCGWFTLFMPVIGIIGTYLTIFNIEEVIKAKGLAQIYQQETVYSLEEAGIPGNQELEKMISDETNIEPVIDILAGDDEDLKRGAITFLEKAGTAEAVNMLKICLKDDSPEVRFMAHTTITKMDKRYIDKIQRVQEQCKDKKQKNNKPLHKLAELYAQYATSNLVDQVTTSHYLQKSLTTFKQQLEYEPDNLKLLTRLGQISCLNQNYKEAEQFFNNALRLNSEKLEAHLGLCEVYYEENNLLSLKAGIEKINLLPNKDAGDFETNIMIQFWIKGFDNDKNEQAI